MQINAGGKNIRGKGKKKKRPWWDSNPQSPAPEADALSIRPQGQTGLLKGSVRVHINVDYCFGDTLPYARVNVTRGVQKTML